MGARRPPPFWRLLGLSWGLVGALAVQVMGAAPAPMTSEAPFEVRGLGTCGVVTRYASTQIPDPCLQEALNVYLDEDLGISRRRGFAQYNATAITDTRSVRGVWPFRASDGTEYVVVLSSSSMFQSNGQGTFTVIAGLVNLSSTQDMDCVAYLGRLWCVNGVDTMFSWDGTSTGTISGAPTCNLIDAFRNRIVLSNCTSNQSRLYLSGELDGTDYTVPSVPVSTSPSIIAVGGVNDGNRIACLLGVYQDVFVVGKLDSLYGLYGFDRRDFAVRELSREVGCTEPRSPREKQGALYWMSKRGVERMRGPTIERVSDPIRDLVDTIITAAGNSRSAQDTTQTDFEAGTLAASGAGAAISATLTPGSISPSSWTILVESSGDFAGGTLTNVTTTSVFGKVTLEQGEYASFSNAGAEVDDSTNWTGTGAGGFERATDSSMWGSSNWYEDASITCNTWRFRIRNSDGETIYTQDITSSNGTDTTFQVNTSTWVQKMISLYFTTSCSPAPCIANIMTSANFIRGKSVRMRVKDEDATSSCRARIDIDETASAIITTATYQTQVYDTALSSPVFGPFYTAFSSTTQGAVTFEMRSATSASGEFSSFVAVTSGTVPDIPERQFVQYRSSFTVHSTTNAPGELGQMFLAAATTGYFISQCRNPGTAITSWGLFQCNSQANGGSVSFAVSTGATCHATTRSTATWNTQVNNSVITLATTAFVAYRALFTLDVGTDAPTIQDCTFNWNEGTSRPSVAGEVYRDRLYIAYTTSTAASPVNDNMLVLDSRDQWVLHDAPNCSSLGVYQRRLYCGDSANTGRLFHVDVGHDDDTASFTSRIRTKDYDLGNTFQKKRLNRIYYNLSGLPDPTYSIALTPSYYVDASTDVVTMDNINLNEDYSRFIAAKAPPPMNQPTAGRWFALALEHSGTQGPWKLFGIKLSFTRLRED